MLPALPLDGGRILRSLMSKFIGNKRATKLTAILGIVFSGVIALTGIFFAIRSTPNYSMFLMAVFLCYAALTELKNEPYKLIRDISGKKEMLKTRKALHIRGFAVPANAHVRDVLKELDAGRYNLIYVLNKEMKVEYELSETDIIDGMLKHGSDISLKSIVKEKKEN